MCLRRWCRHDNNHPQPFTCQRCATKSSLALYLPVQAPVPPDMCLRNELTSKAHPIRVPVQALVRAVAEEVRRAGKTDRVFLGSLDSPAIWCNCYEELPQAPRILPMREVRQSLDKGRACHIVATPSRTGHCEGARQAPPLCTVASLATLPAAGFVCGFMDFSHIKSASWLQGRHGIWRASPVCSMMLLGRLPAAGCVRFIRVTQVLVSGSADSLLVTETLQSMEGWHASDGHALDLCA